MYPRSIAVKFPCRTLADASAGASAIAPGRCQYVLRSGWHDVTDTTDVIASHSHILAAPAPHGAWRADAEERPRASVTSCCEAFSSALCASLPAPSPAKCHAPFSSTRRACCAWGAHAVSRVALRTPVMFGVQSADAAIRVCHVDTRPCRGAGGKRSRMCKPGPAAPSLCRGCIRCLFGIP